MIPETGIFYRYKCVDKIRWEFIISCLLAVGSCSYEGVRDISLAVINGGRIADGDDAFYVYVRRIVNNSFHHTKSNAADHDYSEDAHDKAGFKKTEK